VGAAFTAAGNERASGQLARAAAIHDAASNAFLHGLQGGCLVAGGVAAGGVLLAALFLPSQPTVPVAESTSAPLSLASRAVRPRRDEAARQALDLLCHRPVRPHPLTEAPGARLDQPVERRRARPDHHVDGHGQLGRDCGERAQVEQAGRKMPSAPASV